MNYGESFPPEAAKLKGEVIFQLWRIPPQYSGIRIVLLEPPSPSDIYSMKWTDGPLPQSAAQNVLARLESTVSEALSHEFGVGLQLPL